jgi:hypothetical protein
MEDYHPNTRPGTSASIKERRFSIADLKSGGFKPPLLEVQL